MVGGHEKQSDSNTTSTHQHQHQRCLQIGALHHLVRVDTQYVGIIEEQKQQFKELIEELAEFNHV